MDLVLTLPILGEISSRRQRKSEGESPALPFQSSSGSAWTSPHTSTTRSFQALPPAAPALPPTTAPPPPSLMASQQQMAALAAAAAVAGHYHHLWPTYRAAAAAASFDPNNGDARLQSGLPANYFAETPAAGTSSAATGSLEANSQHHHPLLYPYHLAAAAAMASSQMALFQQRMQQQQNAEIGASPSTSQLALQVSIRILHVLSVFAI